MDYKIVNGTIVTATDTYRADVGIKNGKVVQIAKKIKESAGEVIDAKGLYVLPGGIDIHTHLDMPFMGSFSSDDFETGTIAAAFGGTTSLVDFAIQGKRMSLKGTLNTWMKKARKKAVIDYGFHVAITDLNDRVMNEIPEMVAMGVPSFKCFLAYKGALMIDDGALYRILQKTKKAGALVMIHAENGDVLDILINDLLAQGKTEPKYHALSRPPEAEAEATGRGIAIAQMAGAPIYIVHLTCKEALAKVKEARDAGFPVLAETCPQYLLKSYQNYLEPGFQGAKYVMSPPLRDKSNWDVLWKGLAYGDLQVVSTDHCPFNFKGQKDKGKKNFALIPNGAPGIEHRIMLLFHEGVNKKKIGLNRFVELVSTAPAKLFGLFPQKGTVAVGTDADLVLFDPKAPFKITAKTHHQNVDYTPYEGFTGKGVPKTVFSNGQIIVNDGKFLGKPGTGRFLKRRPFRLTA
ncbi:MAG: dihydropyrimidinase [Deltaproteobacteria bacterium]|nr:MAG: dihydropyrimidinase [Deltaproteobacteria bacterium]HDZ89178.1 dihydropyrimidinase [Deltaproteobacteria bacterium]